MAAKKALESRTIQFNAIMGVLAAITTNMFLLEEVMSPLAYGITMFVLTTTQSVGGVYLRYITKEPIE